MILDAAETVLGFFGFDRTAYSGLKKNIRRRWFAQHKEQETLKLGCIHPKRQNVNTTYNSNS
jgi:hypothetical protein